MRLPLNNADCVASVRKRRRRFFVSLYWCCIGDIFSSLFVDPDFSESVACDDDIE